MSGNERPDVKSEYSVVPLTGKRLLNVNTSSLDADGGEVTSRAGDPVSNVIVTEGKPNITPSDYTGHLDLTAVGQGFAIASGASQIQVGLVVAAAGAVLIAFGTSELDAEANCVGGGTPASLLGTVIAELAVGKTGIVDVPNDPTITHFALAEAHATPTGEVMITQG